MAGGIVIHTKRMAAGDQAFLHHLAVESGLTTLADELETAMTQDRNARLDADDAPALLAAFQPFPHHVLSPMLSGLRMTLEAQTG